MIDLAVLKTEINTDPTGLGLPALVTAGNHTEIARLLNEVKASIQVDNFVSAFDIEEAVDPADWPTPSNVQWKRDLWRDVLLSISSEVGEINANATNLKAKVQLVFDPATSTRTNLAALQTRDGSRIQELFGSDEQVSHGTVSEALAI